MLLGFFSFHTNRNSIMIKYTQTLILLLCCSLVAQAQTQWFNPAEAKTAVIHGQALSNEIAPAYTRLPQRAQADVTPALWNLAQQAAGLSLQFQTNAPKITIKYVVTGNLAMPHMPTTGVSGLDLYAINRKGTWRREIANGYHFGDTCSFTFYTHRTGYTANQTLDYALLLPLYNGVKFLEVGIPEHSSLEWIPQPTEKPIVIYGTSIAQGACASRPGMAWGNILARKLNKPIINWGFSGNGKLETGMLNFVSEVDAALYILDCLPNLAKEPYLADLSKRITDAVTLLRSKHSAPIILVDHASGSFDKGNYHTQKANKISKDTYKALRAAGVKNLHYLSYQDINLAEDALVDYVHPSDYGMDQIATAYAKKIRKILK